MQNKIKLFIYTSIGVSIPFLIRTTLYSYSIRNINSPYLTVYFNSLDLVLVFLFFVGLYKSKTIPFSADKIVDKLWISLFLLIFIRVFFVEYSIISWVWGVRLFLGFGWLWYVFRFKCLASELKLLAGGLILGMFGQFIVASVQFTVQQNIGLPLVTEPVISSAVAGVAKVDILNNILVRAYGTFPHPNILGFISILALLVLYRQFLSKKLSIIIFIFIIFSSAMIDHYIITSIQAYLATLIVGAYIFHNETLTLSPRLKALLILTFHILTLIVFSKWALIVLFFMDSLYLTSLQKISLFHVEQFQNIKFLFTKAFINSASLVGGFLLLLLPYQQIVDTITKRGGYVKDSILIIQSNLWLGVGLGQYVSNLSDNREFWQYEPVHNVFLLILSEIGFFGVGIVLMILLYLCYNYIYGYKK